MPGLQFRGKCIYRIHLYTVGHRSQSSVRQWNLSSDANRGVSTFRRSLDGVDSSGDKTTITTIFRPSASILVATRRQSLLSRPSKTISWSASPRNKYVLGSESTSLEQIYATMLLYISVCLRTHRDTISYSFDIYIARKLGLKKTSMAKWQTSLLLTIHDTSHFSKGNAAMCHGANKRQKDWGLWNWETGTGNWDWETGTVKLDWENHGLWKLETVKTGLWNWGLWNWDWENY